MKLEKWALIAEIVSGVAIVLTLLFLVVELRTNTDAVRAQNRQAVADGVRQVTLAISTTPGLADLISGTVPLDEATPAQRDQLRSWFNAWFKSAEEAYLQYENGLLEEEVWLTRRSQAVAMLRRVHMRRLYEEVRGSENYISRFLAAMEQALDESNDE